MEILCSDLNSVQNAMYMYYQYTYKNIYTTLFAIGNGVIHNKLPFSLLL